MKCKFPVLILLAAALLCPPAAFSQYAGGSGDGYGAWRSDDVVYDGTEPEVTGDELPDIVRHLTINNPAGVTLSKNIVLTGTLSILNGDFNLNGFVVTFGENATLVETPGNIVIGGGGAIQVTRALNDLTEGQNVGNLGLKITTPVPLGVTTIARGNVPQVINPDKISGRRFFDVVPTNNQDLNATVEFRYDESELDGTPEADLTLFISHDATAALAQNLKGGAQILADPTWEFLGGTVNSTSKTISKGGVGGFSRLTIVRSFVLFGDEYVRIEGNKYSAGDIHSNGSILFEKGEPGKHSGNLTAVNDIAIFKSNVIEGNVYAGGRLYVASHASVTGKTEDKAAVAGLGLPAPVFTAPKTGKVYVPRKGTLNLPPGTYGKIEIDKRGTLQLSAGDYFVNELEADDGAVLAIDVAGGPVNINVVSELEIDEKVEVSITPGGHLSSNQVTFTTLQRKELEIGEESLFMGWLIAPHAKVLFEEDCGFKGAVVAKAIALEEGVIFVPHSFVPALPRPRFTAEEEAAAGAAAVSSYELAQNYPNPFNPSTTIRFNMPEAGAVQLSIYNISGQEVRRLVSGELAGGRHALTWDGRDDHGQLVPSGIYFYRLRVNGFEQTRKMSFLK